MHKDTLTQTHTRKHIHLYIRTKREGETGEADYYNLGQNESLDLKILAAGESSSSAADSSERQVKRNREKKEGKREGEKGVASNPLFPLRPLPHL